MWHDVSCYRPDDYLPPFVPGTFLMQPDCTSYTDLPYSPYAFEHLDGMKDRKKLPGTPELGLKNAITYKDNVDEYGHRIYEAFKHVRPLFHIRYKTCITDTHYPISCLGSVG